MKKTAALAPSRRPRTIVSLLAQAPPAPPAPSTPELGAFCACGHRFGLHAADGPHQCLGATGAGACGHACSGFMASALERRR